MDGKCEADVHGGGEPVEQLGHVRVLSDKKIRRRLSRPKTANVHSKKKSQRMSAHFSNFNETLTITKIQPNLNDTLRIVSSKKS